MDNLSRTCENGTADVFLLGSEEGESSADESKASIGRGL
jgi:hypothetical protein